MSLNKLASAAALAGLTATAAAQTPPDATAITIYSSALPGAIAPEMYRNPGRGGVPGYAVIRQEREVDIAKGRNDVRFSDVAALIDPTTVVFESLTDPKGTSVVEQNFQFDLVSTDKLLRRYVDRQVAVDQIRGQTTETFTGTLLSTQDGLVLKRDDGTIQILPHNAGVKLPALPGGLITRPTLVWSVEAKSAGRQRTRVAYQTQGITWWADYNLTYSEAARNECRLDLGAWVSIVNTSGAGYQDAKLKLVAGEVNRAPSGVGRMVAKELRAPASAAVADGFAEKPFFEYHLYTLGRATTLPDNSTKQIELFPVARGVPCQRTLVYYGRPDGGYGFLPTPITDRSYGIQTNRQVDVYLQFRNADSANLGMPLPRGRVRVSKLDPADRTLEFIGEDSIDHTPKNEKVLLKMGSAFDVVGERRQMDFRVDAARRTMSEDIEVSLRNAKREPVEVQVKETLYRWTNWEIVSSSHTYRKEDARTIYFPVTVPPGEEVTVRYTVRYTW
ncbi:MAG TPA: hypothetical protein VMG60_03515 [Burkholderiaceae bacterium]|nr:hypothetical protein [Burkholderiaceae bacterium]